MQYGFCLFGAVSWSLRWVGGRYPSCILLWLSLNDLNVFSLHWIALTFVQLHLSPKSSEFRKMQNVSIMMIIMIYKYLYIYLYINYISWCDMLFSVHLLVRMSPSDVPIVLNAATMQFAIPMHIIASTAPRNCLLINSWLICLALWWLQIALPIFSAKALQIKFCLRGFRISDLEASSWWIWFEY